MARPKGSPKVGGRTKGTPNKATADVRALAQLYTDEAILTLVTIMKHGDAETARIAAARELLDRGHGRATQVLAGDLEHPMQMVIMTGVPRPETGH